MSRRSSAVRNLVSAEFSETDLNKLQQQYRSIEIDKHAYIEKTEAIIYRDNQEIQRLQEENEKLLRTLRVTHSSSNCWLDASLVRDLTALLDQEDRIDEELEAEKGKVTSLKDEILRWERKLAGQNTDGGPKRCSMKSINSNLAKRTGIVESKLCRSQQCLNNLMTRNGELREEIEALLVEKRQFLLLKSDMEKELHAVRKEISNLTIKCTEAFNDSAKIQEKQMILSDQNTKDVAQYIKEKSNMEREISHYCYLEEFFDIKAIARSNQDADNRKGETCKQLKSKEMELEEFENAVKQILKETEESDLDKLIRKFIQMEEENYRLLNFINHQHDEAEAIQRQVLQLCSEIAVCMAEQQQEREQHHTRLMKVSLKQEATEQQVALYEQRVGFIEKLLDQLKDGLRSMLQMCYGSSVISDQMGPSGRVQDEDIKEYMRMVDDRVSELLSLQCYLHFQEKFSQWDPDSVSIVAGQLLGITLAAGSLATAAATAAPEDDPDMVEAALLEEKEPVIREDLLTLVNERIERKKKTDGPQV